MALLGAIIAGGRATRFGSDKGAALIDGVFLIDHVAAGLGEQVDALVIVGRAWPRLVAIADHPRPDLGPLGGLCGALRYAAANGFDLVATAPCDLLPVPNFEDLIAAAPAFIEGHEICGVWPTVSLTSLEAFIAQAPKLSMKAWIEACGAVGVVSTHAHFDLNTPQLLANFRIRP